MKIPCSLENVFTNPFIRLQGLLVVVCSFSQQCCKGFHFVQRNPQLHFHHFYCCKQCIIFSQNVKNWSLYCLFKTYQTFNRKCFCLVIEASHLVKNLLSIADNVTKPSENNVYSFYVLVGFNQSVLANQVTIAPWHTRKYWWRCEKQ